MTVIRHYEKEPTEAELTEWLRALRAHAHVPASGYAVASIFRVEHRGAIYYIGGVNVENIDHRLSTHGEEGVLAAMVTALGPDAQITRGWLMGAPQRLKEPGGDTLGDTCGSCCGKCRQQLAAFADPAVPVTGFALNGGRSVTHTIGEMLPDMFTDRTFRLATEQVHETAPPRTLAQARHRLIRECPPDQALDKAELTAWLRELQSVDTYSAVSQAVIVRLSNGAYVAGTKIEDAAFISIDPMQSAMAVATGEFGPVEVKEVWCFGTKRDAAAKGRIPENCVVPLTLSAIQILSEFHRNPRLPIHYMDEQGRFTDTRVDQAMQMAPSFQRPAMLPQLQRY